MLDRRRGIVLPFGGDVFRGKRLFFDGLEAQGNQADVLVPFLRPPLERRENVRGRGGYDHGVPFGPRGFFRLFQVGEHGAFGFWASFSVSALRHARKARLRASAYKIDS